MLRSLKFTQRLHLLIAIFSIGFIVYGAWSLNTLDQYKVGGPISGKIDAAQNLISDVLPPPEYIIESYLVCLQLKEARRFEKTALIDRLTALREEYAKRHAYWRTVPLEQDLQAPLDEAHVMAMQFYAIAFDQFLPAVRADKADAAAAALTKMTPIYELHRMAIDKLVVLAKQHAEQNKALVASDVRSATVRQAAILALFLTLAIVVAALIRRSIVVPLGEAVAIARRIAKGDLRTQAGAHYRDETGQLLEALHHMSDSLRAMLDAREQSETASRQARELLENLIETANVIVVGLDNNGRVSIFNRVAEVVSGYPRSEVLGRKWVDLGVLPEPQPWQKDVIVGKSRMPLANQQTIMGKNGLIRTIAWRNSVQEHSEASSVALISVGIDVTEQLKAETALIEAKHLAEAANRSKSEFLANISHEIRTPMNAVIGMTGLALRTDLSDKQRNYLVKANAAAHGLLGIVNDVLDYSKIEAGKLHFESRDFYLENLLGHLSALLGFKAQDKGLELLFDIDACVPTALIGDEMRLSQVLLNLLSNAIKFTSVGEVCLRIECIEQEDGQVLLRFEIRDTGIGISESQRAKLFSAFVQADSTTTRNYGGTGLGLTISKRLVEMMNGQIWVESQPGVGSSFIFTARVGVQSNQDAHRAAASPNLENMRALVVDDNDSALEIMSGILKSFHLEVNVATSSEAGIAELEAAKKRGAPYNLVLLDWKMPTVDGLEAVRRIRLNEYVSETLTIVMVTAYSRDELMEKSAGMHIDGVLEKPVSPSNVMNIISAALYKTREPEAAIALDQVDESSLARLRGAHVLLVEDNAVNQELATDVLNSAGIIVDVANDGAEAVSKVARAGRMAYDAILMDWQMPVMDGFEATRRIRADPRFAELPILAMTANAMVGDREKCLAAGMNDHIAKPIDIDRLAAALVRWIPARKKQQEQGVEQAPDRPYPAMPAAMDAEDFPALPGVDVEGARRRLRGNGKMYRRLMQMFVQDQAQAGMLIASLLKERDRDAAQRAAHNLKGLAANLGATEVARVAQELEHAIRHEALDSALVAAGLEALSEPLRALLKGIADAEAESAAGNRLDGAGEPAVEGGGLDIAALGPHLDKLAGLLEEDDSRAANVAASIAVLSQGGPSAQAFAGVIEKIRRYDFPAALHLLHLLHDAAAAGVRTDADALPEDGSIMTGIQAKE
ncbi:response regulator [Oxalobacteraceae bacterium CAVE-383]|nr:response regulator [Oxalobacteraceae bacterium CAVE-383]